MLGSRKLAVPRDRQPIRCQQFMETVPESITDVLQPQHKSRQQSISDQRLSNQLIPDRPSNKHISINDFLADKSDKKQNQIHQETQSNEVSTRNLFTTNMEKEYKVKFDSNDNKGSCSQNISENQSENPKQFFQNNFVLKEIIKKYKIKSIVSNFIKKIKRTSVLRKPVQFNRTSQFQKGFLWKESAIQLPQYAENFITLISVIQIFGLAILSSITLVYDDVKNSDVSNFFQIFSSVFSFLELIINLTTVKYSSGKKLRSFIQIWKFYYHGSLMIDFSTVIILFCYNFIDSKILVALKLIIFFKIPQSLQKMQKLEVYFINNFYNQQYWSLVKILLFNFSFAHIIAIFLTAMTFLNPDDNWMTAKGIGDKPWFQQYTWSYYWANTIMLTVGFGDLVASNYQQALCLVFIETFSCMALAYNINCVGGIIQHIRSQDAERSKKSKIFKKLTDKNQLPEQITWKINNYIEENAELRKKFNFQEERQFISSLPVQMKRQYLKQSNKKLFQNITFFKSFISKTLYNFAEKIEMKVSHPQEVIQHVDDDYNLIILKAGQLGFACKKPNFQLKDFVMDFKGIKQTQNPFLVNMDFVVRKRPFYQIRSVEYSIFFFLHYDRFIQILRQTEMDYQFYCTMRDRMKSIPDQYQVFECNICEGKHLKAICPRLHFIPYNQTIIHRYLFKQQTNLNERNRHIRRKIKNQNSFQVYRKSINNVQKLGNIVHHKRRKRTYVDQFNIEQSSDHSVSSSMSNQQTLVERQIKLITQKYTNSNYQIIKDQLNRFRNFDHQEDEVWLVKLDQLSDFNGYFPQDNPMHISLKFQQANPAFRSDTLLKVHTTMMLQQKRTTYIEHSKKNGPRKESKKIKGEGTLLEKSRCN